MTLQDLPRLGALLRSNARSATYSRLRALQYPTVRYYATTRAPETDKSRILEKPARFNPPSHGSRRVRPRMFPGPRLTDEEVERQKTKTYPNMMPPEGTFMHSFLTDRRLHLWITLSVLTSLAVYAWSVSFLTTTIYREQLPSWSEAFSHPFASLRRFISVYKLHVAHQSEEVAAKRRRKLEDVQKRKEFLRDHGVEPGFLTGSWMDKFGTIEGDQAKEVERMAKDGNGEGVVDLQSPVVTTTSSSSAPASVGADVGGVNAEEVPEKREKKKPKMWLGIW